MSKYILIAISIFINILSFAQTGKIIVEVSNIKNNDGIIYIGIYNNPETFPKANVVAEKKIKAQKSSIEYTFSNIDIGNYAVDGKIGRYFFGMPSEDFAFSRNPSNFGLPKYEDCNFELKENKIITVKIKLK